MPASARVSSQSSIFCRLTTLTGTLPDSEGRFSIETSNRKLFPSPDPGSPGGLTGRETQILRWVANGKTNKQIAKMLSRSVRTVEYHRNRLMKKLNAHTSAEMVKQAIKMGIL